MGDVDKQPDALIYEITKALWNDNTRKLLDAGPREGQGDPEGDARSRAPAFRSIPGAEKFYKEAGLLK